MPCVDYLDAVPQGHQRGVVFLVHGFPDISLAWRYQIPMLLGLGMRCIAIDCMGYGETAGFQWTMVSRIQKLNLISGHINRSKGLHLQEPR